MCVLAAGRQCVSAPGMGSAPGVWEFWSGGLLASLPPCLFVLSLQARCPAAMCAGEVICMMQGLMYSRKMHTARYEHDFLEVLVPSQTICVPLL